MAEHERGVRGGSGSTGRDGARDVGDPASASSINRALLQRKLLRRKAEHAGQSGVEEAPNATHSVANPTIVKPAADALRGTLVVSNNPEAVYQPGRVLDGIHAGPGHIGVYVHHGNHVVARNGKREEGVALDFYLVVHASGTEALHGGTPAAQKVGHGGGFTDDYHTDANFRTSKDALGLPQPADPSQKPKNASTLKSPIFIGTAPAPRPPGDGGDANAEWIAPLMDARYDLDLDGPATIDVVCVPQGTPPSEAEKVRHRATGNTKMNDGIRHGRAAGAYTGAQIVDARTFDVTELAHPIMYMLSASNAHAAPAPTAIAHEQKQALALAPEDLGRILEKAASADDATLRVVEAVYSLDPRWLTEKGVIGSGNTIDKKAALFASDPSFKVMILDLVPSVQQDLDALKADKAASGHKTPPKEKDAKPPATPEVKPAASKKPFAAQHTYARIYTDTGPKGRHNNLIGANADDANYGAIYDLHFTLLNNKGPTSIKLSLDNQSSGVFRGAVEVHAPGLSATLGVARDTAHEPPPKGKSPDFHGQNLLGTIQVPAAVSVPEGHEGPPKPGTAEVHVRMMSAGQISTGQSLDFEAATPPAHAKPAAGH